jgi:hypothetical protein
MEFIGKRNNVKRNMWELGGGSTPPETGVRASSFGSADASVSLHKLGSIRHMQSRELVVANVNPKISRDSTKGNGARRCALLAEYVKKTCLPITRGTGMRARVFKHPEATPTFAMPADRLSPFSSFMSPVGASARSPRPLAQHNRMARVMNGQDGVHSVDAMSPEDLQLIATPRKQIQQNSSSTTTFIGSNSRQQPKPTTTPMGGATGLKQQRFRDPIWENSNEMSNYSGEEPIRF